MKFELGHPAHNFKHGASLTVEFRIWGGMRRRCASPTNTAYHLYGGRGIKVCERWQSFENFLADMGLRPSAKHSLDRVDPSGDYEPGNVRWATHVEQANNKRTSRYVEVRGQRRTVKEWSRISGVHHRTIYCRLDNGWEPEKAVFQPARDCGVRSSARAKQLLGGDNAFAPD